MDQNLLNVEHTQSPPRDSSGLRQKAQTMIGHQNRQGSLGQYGGNNYVDIDQILNFRRDENEEGDDAQKADFSDSTKRKILISCLTALTIGNMMMLNVAAFLPNFIKGNAWDDQDGYELDSTDVSLILSIFAVAQIIFAPFNALIKNKIGTKNAIIFGFFMLTSTTFGLGAISRISDPHIFKYVAVVLRFFQGQGDVLLQITCYSVITQIFSNDIMRYIGYIEIAVGSGLGLGPTLGSIVFGSLQYEKTMYFFGGLNTIGLLFCIFGIPNELNMSATEEEVAELKAEQMDVTDLNVLGVGLNADNKNEKKKLQITWGTLLTNRHCFFVLLTCFIGTHNVVFWTGYMASSIHEHYDLDEGDIGYIFGAQSFTYMFSCLLLPYTCEHSPRKFQFVIAMFGMGICLLMMGPSVLFPVPDSLITICIGFALIGIFQVFVFIPIIPEMLERLQVDLQIVEGADEAIDNQLNDKVNDAYGFVFAFANFVSPLIGSSIQGTYGDQQSFDVFALASFGFGVFFFIFNCGPFVFSENRAFHAKLKALKPETEEEDAPRFGTSNTKGRSKSIGYHQPAAYAEKKHSIFMRPAHIRFGQGNGQEQSELNQISYRKAQISVYQKGAGNRKVSGLSNNYTPLPMQSTGPTNNNSKYGLNTSNLDSSARVTTTGE